MATGSLERKERSLESDSLSVIPHLTLVSIHDRTELQGSLSVEFRVRNQGELRTHSQPRCQLILLLMKNRSSSLRPHLSFLQDILVLLCVIQPGKENQCCASF